MTAGSLRTGSVFLINPNGIVIGPDGKVVTGGSFVASTRSLADPSSLDRDMGFAGTGNGTIVNQGTVRSVNGDVVLVGKQVANRGTIEAKRGTAAMAAGDAVVLQRAGDQRITVKAGTSGDVTNTGTVAAAAAELRAAGGNVYALAGNNGGIVRATGTANVGGHIWLTSNGGNVDVSGKLAATKKDGSGGAVAARAANIDLSGSIDASAVEAGARGGDVSVIATGTTTFSGTIKAEGSQIGKGGQVETSGAHLRVADTARVSTRSEGGVSGNWLLDPNDFTIAAAGSDISGATLSANLGSGDITISSNDGAAAVMAISSSTIR